MTGLMEAAKKAGESGDMAAMTQLAGKQCVLRVPFLVDLMLLFFWHLICTGQGS